MHRTITTVPLLLAGLLPAQELYFPPIAGNTWETVDPVSLGWCMDQWPALENLLAANNSKAFLVLKDGRIAIEHYFGSFTQDSVWYWASAGKSLTAFLVGIAQQEGLLDINDPSSDYLGTGWTSCTAEQELAITVRHQLTMTTGLDDGVDNVDCTDPACLQYLAGPGTRWSYHNAPYTRLDGVIGGASGQAINDFLLSRLTPGTGIGGLYLPVGYNNVFFSKARMMARFGLLMLGQGAWNGTPILSDADYYNAMITPSQALNSAYGYLWWLNGQSSYMLPGLQFVFPGPLMTNEPADAFNALGRDAQIINVVPSENLVVVRMGNAPGENGSITPPFNNDIWELLNAIICTGTDVQEVGDGHMRAMPNPATGRVEFFFDAEFGTGELRIMDGMGRALQAQSGIHGRTTVDVSGFATGTYTAVFLGAGGTAVARFAKE